MDTKVKSKVMQEFTEAADSLVRPSLWRRKEQGGKIVGYFCSYVPDEIITAAGLIPFRMRATGSTGTELSDAYFSSISCSFPRHCFDLALRGEQDFVDGVIFLNSCDHIRRLYDNWKHKVKTPFSHFLSLPRKTDNLQVDLYRDELMNLKESLEKHFNVEITDERLRAAIRLHNETRRLQRRLYELRKAKRPPITGTETLSVMVAGTAMPRERYNMLLKELLNDIGNQEGNGNCRARLMIVGGVLDNPAYVKVIEDQDGLVVTDSLCFGSRTMWKDIDEDADPLTGLARYHIAERPACPRMFGNSPQRVDFVRNMIKEFNVDGVVGERLLFCDQWGFEQFVLSRELKEEGIPYLLLEREYVLSGIGQMRTRVQAFLETIGGQENG